MITPNISPATADQLDDILEISRVTQVEHNTRQPHRFPSKDTGASESMLRSFFSNRPTGMHLFAATEGGSVVGYVLCHVLPAYFDGTAPESVGYICDISISPDFRRKSLGAQLLTHAEEAMRTEGASMLRGNIWRGNDASFSLFQSQGFDVEMHEMGKRIAPYVKQDPPIKTTRARALLRSILKVAPHAAVIFIGIWIATLLAG